jgi:thymidylate synthase
MFKSAFIEGKNIDEVWFALLTELCKKGRKYLIDSGSFAGTHRLEFDYCAGTIHNPIEYAYEGVRKPLAVTVPEGCIAPTTDADIEEYFTDYIMNGQLGANDHYKYATWIVGGPYKLPSIEMGDRVFLDPQLFMHRENQLVLVPNQIQWCIDHYKSKGFGNSHCCIQVGYPESNLAYDVPFKNETERQTSPCMRLIDTKIIKDNDEFYLNFNVYFRSWDLYAGWCVNMGGLALLMEYMAGELGVKPGALSFASKALHVYEHAISQLASRCGIDVSF